MGILSISISVGRPQGFINLNFERATFIPDPSQGYPLVYSTNAIPGWIPYLDGVAQDYIASNGLSLGGAAVSIEGTNNPTGFPPVQGNYFILLQGAGFGNTGSAAIGQTGQIPLTAQSLLFWGRIGDLQITFGGQALSFSAVGSTPNYTIYQADISPFAGQIGELLFSNPNYNTYGIIDNIQFSNTPVPEPSALGLSVLGGLFLACRRWREFFRNDSRWKMKRSEPRAGIFPPPTLP